MADDYETWAMIQRNLEPRVIEVLESKANSEGWTTVCKNVGQGIRGIDLKVQKDNRSIVIEAKGEREGPPQHSSEVKGALGAIIMDMKVETSCHCVAFPDTAGFQRVVRDIPETARRRLGLRVLLVDCPTGRVKVIAPNSQSASDLCAFDGLF